MRRATSGPRHAATRPTSAFRGSILPQRVGSWRSADVRAVGIDTASIDRGRSTDFQSHRVLAGSSVAVFENLANLDRLPSRGAVVLALPMKIRGGSGGPLRAVALVP